MKKLKFICLTAVLLTVLSVPGLASGSGEGLAKSLPFAIGDIEISGGITYNTFAMTGLINGTTFGVSSAEEGLKRGLGFGLNLNYWQNSWFGIGMTLDTAKSSVTFDHEFYGNVTETGRLKGVAVGLNTRFFKDMVRTNVAFGRYNYSLGASFNDHMVRSNQDFAGFGFLVGAGIQIPVYKALSITGSVEYRLASVSPLIDGEMIGNTKDNYINLSGLRIGCGVSYTF